MEIKYSGPNILRRKVNNLLADALLLYAIAGSAYNSVKTGHPSADVATGISKPTALETILINQVLELKKGDNK